MSQRELRPERKKLAQKNIAAWNNLNDENYEKAADLFEQVAELAEWQAKEARNQADAAQETQEGGDDDQGDGEGEAVTNRGRPPEYTEEDCRQALRDALEKIDDGETLTCHRYNELRDDSDPWAGTLTDYLGSFSDARDRVWREMQHDD